MDGRAGSFFCHTCHDITHGCCRGMHDSTRRMAERDLIVCHAFIRRNGWHFALTAVFDSTGQQIAEKAIACHATDARLDGGEGSCLPRAFRQRNENDEHLVFLTSASVSSLGQGERVRSTLHVTLTFTAVQQYLNLFFLFVFL